MIDRRAALKRAMADGVGDDVVDLFACVAEGCERSRYPLIGDLEIAAAGQLLELDQREIGLDSGRVAIHHQTDSTGRGEYRGLSVAEAVFGAEFDGPVPDVAGGREEVGWRRLGREPKRFDRQALVHLERRVIGRPAMVADDPQHVLAVFIETGEGSELLGHFCRSCVGLAGHDRRDGPTDRAALVRIVGNTHPHQQRTDVGETEAQRPVAVTELGDTTRRE